MNRHKCPECGQPVARDDTFCPHCKIFLDWSDAEDAGGESDAPPPVVVPKPAVEHDRAVVTAGAPGGGEPSGRAEAPGVGTAGDPRSTAPPAVTAPVPPRPRPQPVVEQSVDGACPTCSTVNPLDRRFCAKCGHEFDPPAADAMWSAQQPPPPSWWRRVLARGRTERERAALRAYRRSLPLRFRLIRAGGIALVLALVAGAVLAVRGDPVGWAHARWHDFKGTLVPVPDVTAGLDPAVEQTPGFEPGLAVDGDPGTAWATTWTGPLEGQPGEAACGAPQTAAGLLLTFPQPADVRKIRVLAGLPTADPARLAQSRPAVLELRFSDGRCERHALDDTGGTQELDLRQPVSTSSIRVDVLAIHPGEGDSAALVAVSEIAARQRPPR